MTGGTSFLGRHLIPELLQGGDEVFAWIRPGSEKKLDLELSEKMRIFSGDMKGVSALRDQFLAEGIRQFDACIHLAWEGVGAAGRMDGNLQDENVQNTLRLIRFCGDFSCRHFLFSGSQAEYGVTLEGVRAGVFDGKEVCEEAFCRPISEYGKAKFKVLREGSALAFSLGIRYDHLRIFSLYGEGDHETSLISCCLKSIESGEKAQLGPCEQKWDFLHVKDCARALSILLRKQNADRKGSVYNIGSGRALPLKEYVHRIFYLAQKGADCYTFVPREAGPEGTPYLVPDIQKLKKESGWEPEIGFDEGITALLRKRIVYKPSEKRQEKP